MNLDDFLRETADEVAKAHARQAADAQAKCPHCGASRVYWSYRIGKPDVAVGWACGSSRFGAGQPVQRSNECRSAEDAKRRAGIVEAVKLKMSKCPHCGAAQWNDADWIGENLWECGSLVNAGKLMQSPGCMRAELVTLRARVAALEAEIKGGNQ